MWESLKQIRQSGTTILLVSHYLDEVEYLADRLVYLESGRSRFVGSLDEFRNFVRSKVPAEDWKESLTLEEVYLLMSPKTETLRWEGIL